MLLHSPKMPGLDFEEKKDLMKKRAAIQDQTVSYLAL